MDPVSGLKGMRHLALKVRDIRRSKAFYQAFFVMKVVWEPDAQNVYLSSGADNLALHEAPGGQAAPADRQVLDHLGFVVESIERVRELEAEFRSKGARVVHPFKIHRDGSASFYLADPDGIVIHNSFHDSVNAKMPADRIPGIATGKMMRTIAPKRVAPSMRAHSTSSRGMVLKYPISSQVQNGIRIVG